MKIYTEILYNKQMTAKTSLTTEALTVCTEALRALSLDHGVANRPQTFIIGLLTRFSCFPPFLLLNTPLEPISISFK